MNNIIQNLVGLGDVTDQVIATDLLVSVKAGIRMHAFAVTEAATPEVRAVLMESLENALSLHDQITEYMISNGYYHPYNMEEQIKVDVQTAKTALSIAP